MRRGKTKAKRAKIKEKIKELKAKTLDINIIRYMRIRKNLLNITEYFLALEFFLKLEGVNS